MSACHPRLPFTSACPDYHPEAASPITAQIEPQSRKQWDVRFRGWAIDFRTTAFGAVADWQLLFENDLKRTLVRAREAPLACLPDLHHS